MRYDLREGRTIASLQGYIFQECVQRFMEAEAVAFLIVDAAIIEMASTIETSCLM